MSTETYYGAVYAKSCRGASIHSNWLKTGTPGLATRTLLERLPAVEAVGPKILETERGKTGIVLRRYYRAEVVKESRCGSWCPSSAEVYTLNQSRFRILFGAAIDSQIKVASWFASRL
jgi:hypothetical protein